MKSVRKFPVVLFPLLAAALLLLGASPALAEEAPRAGEPAPAASEGGSGTTLVDVNRAGVAELVTLPRVGPALAARIIAHREEAGPFQSIEELLAVKGIGPKLLEGLRGRVSVGGAAGGREQKKKADR